MGYSPQSYRRSDTTEWLTLLVEGYRTYIQDLDAKKKKKRKVRNSNC